MLVSIRLCWSLYANRSYRSVGTNCHCRRAVGDPGRSTDSTQRRAIRPGQKPVSRQAVCEGVSVGPIARSSIPAFFLMPAVDLVHTHDRKALNSGILLSLTRSIPYVLTHRQLNTPGNNPMARSKYGRAEGIVCPSAEITTAMADYADGTPVDTIGDARNVDNEVDATNSRICAARMAAEYLRIYRRILDSRSVPAILL